METNQNPIVLTGREGEAFDLDRSSQWTKNYRDRHPGETVSHFFGKEIIEKILAQENCLGLRLYYAHSNPINGWQRFIISVSNFVLKVLGNIESEKHIIIVGAKSDGSDMLNTPLKKVTPAAAPVAHAEMAMLKVTAAPADADGGDVVG